MRRLLVVFVIALLTAGSAATAALATPGDDARAAAEKFLSALVAEDANTVCSLLTARVVQILDGPEKCVETLSADAGTIDIGSDVDIDPDEDDRDYLAQAVLTVSYQDARAVALGRGGYTSKSAGVERLVRDLRTLEPGLRFSIGRGPTAAKHTSFRHVVVDRRTNGRTLILYAKSDSGTIFRLTAHGFNQPPSFGKAGKGTVGKQPPKPTPPTTPTQPEAPPTFAVTNVFLVDDVSAYVVVSVTYEGETVPFLISMKLENGAWKVDDLLVGLFSLLEALKSAGG